MPINDLTYGAPSTAGLVPFFDPTNGMDRKAPLSELLAFGNQVAGVMTQYAAPNATGFTVLIAPAAVGQSVYLLLTPTAGFAAGTITLPTGRDMQEVSVACTQAVTTLTVNGGTVNGAPATLAANGFFRLRFDGVLNTWNRVG